MHQDFEKFFTEYYSLRAPLELSMYWPLYAPARVGKIKDAINEASQKIGITGRLRSDAKAFLLINLYHMVLQPAAVPRTGYVDMGNTEQRVLSLLPKDVETILAEADSKAGPGKVISGGDILRATAKVYSRLGITKLEIWG